MASSTTHLERKSYYESNDHNFRYVYRIDLIPESGTDLTKPGTPCVFMVHCGNIDSKRVRGFSNGNDHQMMRMSELVIVTDGETWYRKVKSKSCDDLTTKDLAMIQDSIREFIQSYQ